MEAHKSHVETSRADADAYHGARVELLESQINELSEELAAQRSVDSLAANAQLMLQDEAGAKKLEETIQVAH